MRPMSDLAQQRTIMAAAERVVESSRKVGIDGDTLQPDYYEWCAAIADLERRLGEPNPDSGPVPDSERSAWEQAELAIRELVDEDEAVDVLLTLRRLGFAPPTLDQAAG